ncbi:hypothetical protein AB4222_09050 [Vibrio splendidus]
MFFEQITRPFGYLKIKEVKGKGFYDYVLPLILTVLTCLAIKASSFEIASSINTKLVDGFASFVANLPGFYIAALAAVATFNSPQLEQVINTSSNRKPYIKTNFINENKQPDTKNTILRRRHYLCYLFAFLTANSFILVLLNKLSVLIPSNLESFIWLYLITFFFLLWQLVVVTFCGLYYLAERLHVE